MSDYGATHYFIAMTPVTLALGTAYLLTTMQSKVQKPLVTIVLVPMLVSLTFSAIIAYVYPLVERLFGNVQEYLNASFGIQVEQMGYMKFLPPLLVAVMILITLGVTGFLDTGRAGNGFGTRFSSGFSNILPVNRT